MMRNILIQIVIPLFVILSCNKLEPEINTQSQQKIVANSKITDVYEYQYFNLHYSADIKSGSQKKYISNAEIEVEHHDTIYTFKYISNGLYESLKPFSGQYGEIIKVNIQVDTTKTFAQTTMPYPLQSSNLVITNVDTIFPIIAQLDAFSPVDQFFTYAVYDGIPDSISTDTIWNEHFFETRNSVLAIPSGTDSTTIFETLDYIKSDDFVTPIRVEINTISPDIADYLLDLNAYRKTQSTVSLFVNPPLFYTNGVYGLIYGSSTVILKGEI